MDYDLELSAFKENQLKQLENTLKFTEKCKESVLQITQLQKEQKKLLERLCEFQLSSNQTLTEQLGWKQKLESVKSEFESGIAEDLNNLYSLLGYRITEFKNLDYSCKQITLHFNEYCYVTFNQSEFYELLQICPEHPNFREIKRFLNNSQDLPGLLANLRKFFATVMSLKPPNAE